MIRAELEKGRVIEAVKAVTAKLEVHKPEPESAPEKVYGTYEDIVFDDELIAKMMARLSFQSMSLKDLAG